MARDSAPNFYLSTDKEKTKAEPTKKPTPKATPAKSPTPKPTPKPEPKKTPKAEPSSKKESARTTPSPAASSSTADINLRTRQNTPDRNFDPPLDPYGIARAFKQRWDFSSFLITAEEELRFRLDAARSRTLRLARAFAALSSEVEIRQRNLNTAALAAYLLSRDQHSWSPLQGRNLTESQMLAVKATMKQDITAMELALSDYETLRNSLNKSAEEVAVMEKKGLGGLAAPAPDANRPTIPTGELAEQNTESVLEERLVSVEALKATLAAENLSDAGDRRRSIASFAPPPPTAGKAHPYQAAPPQLPSEDVMKAQPRGESVKAPERTALVFPADVNAPVHAVRKGVVMYAGPFRGYGSMVIVEHEKGLFTVYSHLANIQVRERQPVAPGTLLGRAGVPPELGRSGVHFQVRQGKQALKPDDWLGAGQAERLLTKK